MGTNCAPLVADLFLYCYERDFMDSLNYDNQADVIPSPRFMEWDFFLIVPFPDHCLFVLFSYKIWLWWAMWFQSRRSLNFMVI